MRDTGTVQEKTRVADRYELRAPLGRGAMGEVWDGYDQRLDRPVAVKLIQRERLPDEADYDKFLRRFLREAKVAARLNHPGVPTVYDAGVHQDVAFLAMQLITGHDLADVIAERGPLPVPWVAAIGAQVCSVLAAAHAGALVHRDLKPRNLMLCPDGSVKVLDFGIAVVVDSVDVTRLTTTGRTLGTPTYMSPEQASGGEVGRPADLYALGCVLYELFTGAPPFVADLPIAVAAQHLHAAPPPLRPARPDVPAPLAELVGQLLAKRPGDRPGDAAGIYHRLVPHITTPADQGTPPAGELGPTRPFHFPLGPVPVLPGPAAEPPTLVTMSRPPAGPARGTATPDPATQAAAARDPTAPAPAAAVGELERERERAVGLVDEGRVTQAGQVLCAATEAAGAALGADHPEVVDARLALAHVYLLGGDHRRALPELTRLVPDLEQHYGHGHEFVWNANRSIIGCHVALGEYARARSAARDLLARRQPASDLDHPDVVELRQLLGRLERGAL